MAKLRALPLIVLSVLAVSSVRAEISEPVRVETGLVSGVPGTLPGIRVFKGLPFAAPPIGDLRWRPPQPPQKWDGVRAATAFSANCMQRSAGGAAFPPYGGDRTATTMSEDCLYLSVYPGAASARDRRPVMVWIHGGAYTSGAGAIYQGEELARQGVIVVTVNYRLGVFGFLAHPELTKESSAHSSGNYAFLDQIAALKWVQKNISAFGGDPSRVTIFGESAGSWSVNNLVATPLARGLFQRAIGESGGQFSITRTLAEAEAAGKTFADAAGAPSLAALRAMPADAVNKGATGFQTSMTVDGSVLPLVRRDDFRARRIRTMSRRSSDRTRTRAASSRQSRPPASRSGSRARRRYGAATPARFLKLYSIRHRCGRARGAGRGQHARSNIRLGDADVQARLQTQTGKSKVYPLLLSATCRRCRTRRWLGAQHGVRDSCMCSTGRVARIAPRCRGRTRTRSSPRRSPRIGVNSARTAGDPNGKSLPKWDAYQTKDDRAMGFADAPAMIPVPNKAALDFLDAFTQRSRTTRSQP